MKRYISISDLHGRPFWQQIDPEKYQKIIFLGDYIDSREQLYTDVQIAANLRQIITLKQTYPEKVVLLLGNHDVPFIDYFPSEMNNIYIPLEIRTLLTEHQALFQIAYQAENYLWTHAGISQSWWDWYQKSSPRVRELLQEDLDLATILNLLFQNYHERNLILACGRARRGDDFWGGPLWADKSETETDGLTWFHQIVGHTRVDDITTIHHTTGSLTYCDCLHHTIHFHELEL
jgi:predicted MPP superfamily phosphohydrolase